MLPKAERLHREKDFQTVMRSGRRVRHPLMNLYFLHQAGEGRRAGFVVGRRVSNKAVVRNRVRRRLREAYRLRRGQVKPDRWLIFVAQPAAADTDYHQLATVVEDMLKQAGLWEEMTND
jgi:ribonuclease P protein component